MKTLPECVSVRLDDLVGGCTHTYWKDVLWLPQWEVFVFPEVGHYGNLLEICRKKEFVERSIESLCDVTSGYRPDLYNIEIGGSENSAHREGKALDFVPRKFSSDMGRRRLRPLLDAFKIRLENLSTPHMHIDTREPGPSGRYFTP